MGLSRFFPMLLLLPNLAFAKGKRQEITVSPKVQFECVAQTPVGSTRMTILTRYEKRRPNFKQKLAKPKYFLDDSDFSVIWWGRDYLVFAGTEYKLHGYDTHQPTSEEMKAFLSVPGFSYVVEGSDYVIEKTIRMRHGDARVLIPMEPYTRAKLGILVQYYDGSRWQMAHCEDRKAPQSNYRPSDIKLLDQYEVGTPEWRKALKEVVDRGLAEPLPPVE